MWSEWLQPVLLLTVALVSPTAMGATSDDNDEELSVNIGNVGGCITNVDWWGTLQILDKFARLFRTLFRWGRMVPMPLASTT